MIFHPSSSCNLRIVRQPPDDRACRQCQTAIACHPSAGTRHDDDGVYCPECLKERVQYLATIAQNPDPRD